MQSSFKKFLTPQQALQKIQYFCSYQERSHTEVKEKLYSFGLKKIEVETILATLIETNFLNEERFATLFAGGKFRIRKWGKIKIQFELKQKNIHSKNIQKALAAIDEEDYFKTLLKLANAKWQTLKGKTMIAKKVATTRYLLQKGFENALIQQAISNISTKSNTN
ncbi:MAG: RecX family transcriptional regulator [Chitinophagaceae bacterium]|nr:RecX family transcriptional regulator [Chitinophagaceae bacterium]MCW5904810.1 RecX family transcriptional regulator [Chitinophagaceae bacterium]